MLDPDEKVSEEESANPSEREQLIANAVAAYLDQESRGVTVALEEFCGIHPDLQPDLRDQIQALDQIDTVLQFDTHLARAERVTAPEAERATPERLSGNKLLGEIGTGGMGRVFLGFDERLGRKVAIKTLRTIYAENPALRTRFMQEARAMARLSHRHIVRGLPQVVGIVLAEAVPEPVQLSTNRFDVALRCGPAVLRILDQLSPCFRRVAEPREIKGHASCS